jgi:hypothetical protein
LADKQFRNRKKSVGKRWRIEGTYIKIKGLGFKEFKSEKKNAYWNRNSKNVKDKSTVKP